MKSLNDNFFNSKRINNPEKVFGGISFSKNTCQLCERDGHQYHDGDKKDPDDMIQ